MIIAVIGGKLQGVEALYLARKAGYSTLLIDKNPNAVASSLCDQFLQHTFSLEQPKPPDCPHIDLILPAIEDNEVLTALENWSNSEAIPLAFDLNAYSTSRSKLLSNKMFDELKLPQPERWPQCGFPVVVKPDSDSGSQGVQICNNKEALDTYRRASQDNQIVIQEMISGPSFSLEVIGQPGNYYLPQVTQIHVDLMYDCCRVTAPVKLDKEHLDSLYKSSLAIAEHLQLRGIMDVEVILHKNRCKILEIDARLPSQTPIAVYWSTGINMVELLCKSTLGIQDTHPEHDRPIYVSLEHISIQHGSIEVLGEHIMGKDGPLSLHTDFFGADEALSSYHHGKKCWVATLIFTGQSEEEVQLRRMQCHERIIQGDTP